MESAHLTKAHDHARSAASATYDKSIATAGHEHHLASTAFHEARQDTTNDEALRILRLLEDHHHRLAGLIKEAPSKSDKKKSGSDQKTDAAATSPESTTSTPKASRTSTSSSPAPTSRRRLPQSSIASNLAEKRGIPSARRTTSGTAVNVPGSITRNDSGSTPIRDLLAQQSRKADLSKSKDKPKPVQTSSPPPAEAAPTEDNFRRFYSAFGGVISAISPALAFASLPLKPPAPTPVVEPAKDEKAKKSKSRANSPEASRTVKSSVPDLAALISQPALRALREDGAPPLGPNESFYLVPTSGGTVTYASILRDPNAPTTPHTHLNPISEDSTSLKGSSHEEFVDAREHVGPPSPTKARHSSSRTQAGGVTSARSIPAGRGAGLKTLEELALENETLKTLVDKQSKRLQMWEINSQNSFNALAQSFRARSGPGSRNSSDPAALAHALSMGAGVVPAMASPPLPSSPAAPASPANIKSAAAEDKAKSSADTERIALLEARLAAQTAQITDLMSNNEALAKKGERDAQVLARYREQWEKLKAGARKKEAERRERHGSVAGGSTVGKKEGEAKDGNGRVKDEGKEDEDDELQSEADFGKA